MNILHSMTLAALFALILSSAAWADRAADMQAEADSIAGVEGAGITILSPADGARLDAGEEYPLAYEVSLGKGGDHFHVWVDENRGPGMHDIKGSYALPKLTAGEHMISLRIVDKSHAPTGPRKSIRVVAVSGGKE